MKYGRVSLRFQRSISASEKLQQHDILIASSYAPPLLQKPATHKTAGFKKADTCLIIHRDMDYQLFQIQETEKIVEQQTQRVLGITIVLIHLTYGNAQLSQGRNGRKLCNSDSPYQTIIVRQYNHPDTPTVRK